MTDITVASTHFNHTEAGEDLSRQILAEMTGDPPDAVIVFASPDNDYGLLLRALRDGCGPKLMIGCSSAGEFTSMTAGTGGTSAIAFRAPEMQFNASLATKLSVSREDAAAQLVHGFKGLQSADFAHRTAIVLLDALAGHSDDLVDQLTLATGGMYQFAGGGAGDDAKFAKTHVFFGTEAHTDSAVALEVLSNKPIGIGARHGWSPAGDALRVSETADSCVLSLNVSPAVEAFEDYATATSQEFDPAEPLPFFLHNIVGVKSDDGYKLRVPLGISPEGGINFAAEVPAGSTAQIMSTGTQSAVDAASAAVRDAMNQVEREGHTPKAALFFDCVATRLRLGEDFNTELAAVGKELKSAKFAGFNSHGQIVRAEGQFSGFHNCTAVVCVFPD